MHLKLQSNNLNDYLKHTQIIDYDNPELAALAQSLRRHSASKLELMHMTYEYVRDQVAHSADIEAKTVTCRASDVFKAKEGLCYAKSHLLAALLRYNGIPCGFCYQLLQSDQKIGLVLHGLNGVYLEEMQKWIRLDARGNKKNINAQFSTENEHLAYHVRAEKDEQDIPIIFSTPDPNIVNTLTHWQTFDKLWKHLPKALEAAS